MGFSVTRVSTGASEEDLMQAVQERHWELWGHLARNKYADAPSLTGPDYWPSEPSYEGDDHGDVYSHHPDDEAMAERIGQEVNRLNFLGRNALVAFYGARPNLPACSEARAVRLRVPPEWRTLEKREGLKARVEARITDGCFPVKFAA